MNLEYYCLSAMCQYPEATVYGITKATPSDFTGTNRKVYSTIKVLYTKNKSVDLHVLQSQLQAFGIDEATSNMIFHYCLDYEDNWKNNFEELKRSSTYSKIAEHAQEILDLKTKNEPIETISSRAMRYASEWITGTEKKYYSGSEVDELGDESGEPILTGHPIYDYEIYQNGGNRKGQMKGVICREKHGKTRSECWEVAQNIRMGYKVLYLTLEGTVKDIRNNIREVLKHEWEEFRDNLFIVDGVVDLDELEAITLEAVMIEGVDKVVIDYIQEVVSEGQSENVRINNAVKRFRNLMVKHDFHCVALSQAKKENSDAKIPKDANGNPISHSGYRFVPSVYDAYGSNELVKASSIIMIGFRPNLYQELVKPSGLSKKIISPRNTEQAYTSFYMKVERSRQKYEHLHRYWQFIDSDEGLKLQNWT
ncbi:MAG TPA: AAA family ATPase [Massilibacterium sp.]|nr:AAA family ATPase [Massilibacterium sp.]